jgi:hypothetical protein
MTTVTIQKPECVCGSTSWSEVKLCPSCETPMDADGYSNTTGTQSVTVLRCPQCEVVIAE